MRVLAAVLPLLLAAASRPGAVVDAFISPSAPTSFSTSSSAAAVRQSPVAVPSVGVTAAAASSSALSLTSSASLAESVTELKKVLEREYISFFDPMRREYYAPSVQFLDPMTTLEGVDQYQNNVDMLASRTLLGKVLFEEAGIVLHKIEGGDIGEDGKIEDVITRWTLRMTVKILPWSPTARFSGISIYKVEADPSSNVGVQIVGQIDYWDSINILPNSGGEYGPVETSTAVGDFLGQLAPGGFEAAVAAPELPYSLLRRGNGYEVRSYPAYSGVRLGYERRDEGFGSLGAFTKGMKPLAPAILEVDDSSSSSDTASTKYMTWPLAFAPPGSGSSSLSSAPPDAVEKANQDQWSETGLTIIDYPPKVVAVREFNDASMEPVVRKADMELRECLRRDGLRPAATDGEGKKVKFAQYDAIFSMGKRRGEVWIDLDDEKEGGHPW